MGGGFPKPWGVQLGRRRARGGYDRTGGGGACSRARGGGLRFHDLRHSCATWLVTEGVPANVARRVMGHEQTTTTLDLYTHTRDDYEDRIAQPAEE